MRYLDVMTNTEDAWQSAYMNAAEIIAPDAVCPITGHVLRDLTDAEDDACIAEANAQIEAS